MAESITPCSYWPETAILPITEHCWPYESWSLLLALSLYHLLTAYVPQKCLKWWADAVVRLAAAALLSTEKSSKASKAGPLERHSFLHGPTRLSICLLSAANQRSCPPLPRLRQHDPFPLSCKYGSAWGTLCSPENFTHWRMKPLQHRPHWSSLGKYHWAPHCDMWVGGTYLGVQYVLSWRNHPMNSSNVHHGKFLHPWINNGFQKQGFRLYFLWEMQE